MLVIVLDDLGVDKVSAYREHPDAPHTPNIDRLADEGRLFRNAWGSSICSPSLAMLLTGRYPRRHGVGENVNATTIGALPDEEVLIPEMLAPAGYTSRAFGKWHLAPAPDATTLLDPEAPGRAWIYTERLARVGPPPWPNESAAVRDGAEVALADSVLVPAADRPAVGAGRSRGPAGRRRVQVETDVDHTIDWQSGRRRRDRRRRLCGAGAPRGRRLHRSTDLAGRGADGGDYAGLDEIVDPVRPELAGL